MRLKRVTPYSKNAMVNPTPHEIASYLNNILEVHRYSDMGINGLQIESPNQKILKVGFAVDAGLSVMETAVSERCDLLIVHHGVLWGSFQPITGPFAKKIALCMNNGLSLYAAHLPLDGHPTLGNAAQLAGLLALRDVVPCFDYKGATIGVAGATESESTVHLIAESLSQHEGALTPPLVLPFGPGKVSRIGIATGSASFLVNDCPRLGIDLLITGEPKQQLYHDAKELGVSVICMGHYASETFGVRALEDILKKEFRVQTCWISEPTGI